MMLDLEFLRRFSPTAFPDMYCTDNQLTNVPWMPLPIPRIEPDNWSLFWEMWKENKSPSATPDRIDHAIWDNLCIWSSDRIPLNEVIHQDYPTKIMDWSTVFPRMFAQLMTCMPYASIDKITLSSNRKAVVPHVDAMDKLYPWPNCVRVMLWDSNTRPTFYVKKWSKDSLLLPPLESLEPSTSRPYETGYVPDEEKIYVNLPSSTNTFVLNNGEFLHGADLASPKIILLIWGTPDAAKWTARMRSFIDK